MNSAYFNIPGPTLYSDSSIISNLTLSNNTISSPNGVGIHIIGANYGNSFNKIYNLKVNNNTILEADRFGIEVCATINGGNDRNTFSSNTITNSEIDGNVINSSNVGIMICTSSGEGDTVPANGNVMENSSISNNIILNYLNQGIILHGGFGGYSDFSKIQNDALIDVSVNNNTIKRTNNQAGVGIEIFGGSYFVNNSSLSNIMISENIIDSAFIGINIMGGINEGATGNIVEIELDNNTTTNNVIPLQVMNNVNGATDNYVLLTSTGQPELIYPGNIKIYPNPFTTSTTIEYDLNPPETVTITFYNQFGKQVDVIEKSQHKGLNRIEWSPEKLADGVYYFRWEAGEWVASGKVVLMK